MSSMNSLHTRRSCSPVNYKNKLLRSMSNQQHKVVNSPQRKIDHQNQPIHYYQLASASLPAVAYLSNLPPAHLKIVRTSHNVQPIKKSIIIHPPSGAQHIDINFEIRIKTPQHHKPTIPELSHRFSYQGSPQEPQPTFTETHPVLQYKINKQQPIVNRTEKKRDLTSELTETRVVDARQMFNRIKCSVCNSTVSADDIDQHYESHEKKFKIEDNVECIKSVPSRMENVRPFETRNESPYARKPNISGQLENQNNIVLQMANPQQKNTSLTHKETPIQAIILQQQQQPVKTSQDTSKPVFDFERRISLIKRMHTPPHSQLRNIIEQHRMSRSSLKKLSLVKKISTDKDDILSIKPPHKSLTIIPLQRHERSSSHDTEPKRESYIKVRDSDGSQPKLSHFQYNYDRIATKHFVSSESVISMSSSLKPKVARNILAQSSPEPIQTDKI